MLRRLALAVALLAAALPTTATAAPDAGDECGPGVHCGVIPVGTGRPLANRVDHLRFDVPEGAVGIVVHPIIAEGPLPVSQPLFGLLTRCPPGMACTQEVVDPPCLAVYAREGALGNPYAFSWALDAEEATLLLHELPRHYLVPTPPGPTPGFDCR